MQPVVEQDARNLAAIAGAGAVTQHPATPEAHGVLSTFGRRRDDIEGLIDRPRPREMTAMGLAGIDDTLELGIRKETSGDDPSRQAWPVAGLWRRHRRHRRGLHQAGRMRAGPLDAK